MSKPKTMIKQSKKKKKEQVLEDADDFLAAGVEHEESAGKWRAGDAVKSLRFFNRAVETYNQGLSRFPNNLDLAYNKARVELEVATHPLLVRHIDAPLITVLEAALTSHRYALDLDPNNADTLFNIAQVLVAIAEELGRNDSRTADALQFLEEALEMQNRCLSVQELKWEESEQQRLAMEGQAAASAPDGSGSTVPAASSPGIPSSTGPSAAEDQWFSILEPITADTLIDTILAQLATLTTLCSIISTTFPPPPTPTLSWISSYPEPLLTEKLPHLTTNSASSPARLLEIALCRANFLSRLLEAGFRHLTLPQSTYHSELSSAFSVPELSLLNETQSSYDTLLAHAESLLFYTSALSETPSADGHPFAPQRWAALSQTITLLATASKLSNLSPSEAAKTHFLRGDASLYLAMLAEPSGGPYEQAVKNRAQLLRNAEVFYRNASRLIPAAAGDGDGEETEEQEMKAVAGLRCTVAQVLQGKDAEVPVGSDTGREEGWVKGQLEEMVEEGLVRAGVL